MPSHVYAVLEVAHRIFRPRSPMSGRRLLPVYHLMDNMMMSDRSPNFNSNSNCVNAAVDAINQSAYTPKAGNCNWNDVRMLMAAHLIFNHVTLSHIVICDHLNAETNANSSHSMLISTQIYILSICCRCLHLTHTSSHFQFSVYLFLFIFLPNHPNQNEIPTGMLPAVR